MEQAAKEQKDDARTRKHMEEMASRDWKRDFGHCFRSLYEGLDEDLANTRRERLKKSHEEQGLDPPTEEELERA